MSTPAKYEGHTPGPWHAKGNCIRYRLPGFSTTEKLADCGTEANARLIADAPALLADNERLREALRAAIGFCVAFREDVPDWQRFPQVGHLFAKVTAALAEGKGDQP